MNIKKIKIGELCQLKYGDSLPERSRVEGNVPVYGSNGIVGYHHSGITSGETIIVGRKGSVGKIQYSSVECFPIDTTYYIDETLLPCDLKWLYYNLLSQNLSRFNKAAAVPGINRNDVYDITINYADLQKQKQIAQVLEDADRARQQRKAANVLTEQFLQSSFLHLFGDPLMNEKEWQKVTVKEMGIVKTGNTPSRDVKDYYGNFIEWIKSDNISLASIHPFQASEYLSQRGLSVGRSVEKNSILVTCIAGSTNSIGNVVLTDRKVSFNQQINSLTPSEEYEPLFVYGLFKQCKKLIQESTTQGMKRIITKSVFEKLEMIKPPLSLQQHFASLVADTEILRQKQQQSERELEQLFQALLQQFFGAKSKSYVTNLNENLSLAAEQKLPYST